MRTHLCSLFGRFLAQGLTCVLAAARLYAEGLLELWWTLHAAPANCQYRVVKAVAFCLGSPAEYRELVHYLELGPVLFLAFVSFALGRHTADRQLTC